MPESQIGRYAKSIESGWVGKVVGIETDEKYQDATLRMQGVNYWAVSMLGGHPDDHLDLDDTQWFDPRDVVFLT